MRFCESAPRQLCGRLTSETLTGRPPLAWLDRSATFLRMPRSGRDCGRGTDPERPCRVPGVERLAPSGATWSFSIPAGRALHPWECRPNTLSTLPPVLAAGWRLHVTKIEAARLVPSASATHHGEPESAFPHQLHEILLVSEVVRKVRDRNVSRGFKSKGTPMRSRQTARDNKHAFLRQRRLGHMTMYSSVHHSRSYAWRGSPLVVVYRAGLRPTHG